MMSGDGSKEGPDYFGFFTNELEDLFSKERDGGGGDDYFPLMSFKSDDIQKEMRENDVNGTSESGGVKRSEILFCDGLGGELSDYRKEKLKGLLKQSVSALTHEVDQMVEVVLATCQLQHQLRSKVTTTSSSQGLSSGGNDGAHPSKKHKKSTSLEVISTPALEVDLERPKKLKSLSDILSQNEKYCVYCNVTETSMWRRTPDGSRMCNACGLRLRKGTSQISPGKKDRTIAGSLAEAGSGSQNEKVTDDLKFLLDNDREQVEQTMKKYVDEISSSLGHMEQQLEGFLDNMTSKCRNMTFFEKQHLWKMVKDMPRKNFDRVVEIIRHGKGLDRDEPKDIFVDLEDMDNTVLWRLYYYAKAVENAQKLLA